MRVSFPAEAPFRTPLKFSTGDRQHMLTGGISPLKLHRLPAHPEGGLTAGSGGARRVAALLAKGTPAAGVTRPIIDSRDNLPHAFGLKTSRLQDFIISSARPLWFHSNSLKYISCFR
jgi:hypothetical protein